MVGVWLAMHGSIAATSASTKILTQASKGIGLGFRVHFIGFGLGPGGFDWSCYINSPTNHHKPQEER